MFGLNSDVEVMVGDVGAKATAVELEDSVGASLGAEIDIGSTADTVCDKAVSAWNDVKKGWETVTSCF